MYIPNADVIILATQMSLGDVHLSGGSVPVETGNGS